MFCHNDLTTWTVTSVMNIVDYEDTDRCPDCLITTIVNRTFYIPVLVDCLVSTAAPHLYSID